MNLIIEQQVTTMMMWSVVLALVCGGGVGVRASSSINEKHDESSSITLSTATECFPDADFSSSPLALSSSSSSSRIDASTNTDIVCDEGQHCVFNNHSSLGGYCTIDDDDDDDDDDESAQSQQHEMEMPKGLKKVCFICETPGSGSGSSSGSGSNRNTNTNADEKTPYYDTMVVTVPEDKVGAFTCGQLDVYGRSGSLPSSTNCETLRWMIHETNVCGCTTVATATTTATAPATLTTSTTTSTASSSSSRMWTATATVTATVTVTVASWLLSFFFF